MSPGGAPRGPAPAPAPAARPQAMPRERRLKRRRLIRPLFDAAAAPGRLASGVIQLRWAVARRTDVGADSPLQVGFAPGRRTTKVTRNRVRRVMRETWRAHQAPLLDLFAGRPAETLTVFALFRGREATAEAEIRRDLPRAMADLVTAAGAPGPAPAE